MKKWIRWKIAATALMPVVCAMLAGCDTSSAEGVVRTVDIVVTGFYMHPTEGNNMVPTTSGAPVESLNLRQSGDQLEGVDNNGIIFRGSIGRVIEGAAATFTLQGAATSGQPVTISGNIEVSGGNATMRGTWIEPTLYSTVYGQATVPQVPTDGGGNGGGGNGDALAVAPSSVRIAAIGGTQVFTASGGQGRIIWTLSRPDLGAATAVDGSRNERVTYAANGTGNNVITATDEALATASASIAQEAGIAGPPTP